MNIINTLNKLWKNNLLLSNTNITDSSLVIATVGSKAHNTYISDINTSDDIDVQGIFVPSIDYFFGLNKIESWVGQDSNANIDYTFHSLSKFSNLLLKGNPNTLCLLFLEPEFYLHTTPEFETLKANKDLFLHQEMIKSFIGYGAAQIHRMTHFDINNLGEKRKNSIDKFGYSTKEAAHALKILNMGIEFASTGAMKAWRPEEEAKTLRDIKLGKYRLQEVNILLESTLSKLKSTTNKLPNKPDYSGINNLLINLHKSHLRIKEDKLQSIPNTSTESKKEVKEKVTTRPVVVFNPTFLVKQALEMEKINEKNTSNN